MCSEFLSKYNILSKLGEGSFSDVLKCKCLSTGEIVAVKKLKKEFKHVSEIRYLSELTVSSLSDHTNVLTLSDFIYDHGKLYMVFEIMDMSLYDLIQAHTRCLPENKVKHMFHQILKGVDHLHSNGLLHRDIKPENILVKKSTVKLADLGSVRETYDKPPYTDYMSTRWYRAPECILSAGFYGAKADVWACGCVYYEMLTSKPIFPGENQIDQLTKIHQIIGTPNSRLVTKMCRPKSRISDMKFATFPSTNVAALIPFTSDGGREILKCMLIYDPDTRTNTRRLLEHRYFNDLREKYSVKQSRPIISNNTKSIKNNKSCYSFQTVKLKPTEMSNKNTEIGRNLSTNSWGPSTCVNKFVSTSTKSRGNNQIVCNTRQKYNPPNQTTLTKKTPPDHLKIKKPSKDLETNKVKSLSTIPTKNTLRNRRELVWTKEMLPPILEL